MSKLPIDVLEEVNLDEDEFETDMESIDLITYDDLIDDFHLIIDNALPWDDTEGDWDGY